MEEIYNKIALHFQNISKQARNIETEIFFESKMNKIIEILKMIIESDASCEEDQTKIMKIVNSMARVSTDILSRLEQVMVDAREELRKICNNDELRN